MGCLKLHILENDYKKPDLKISWVNKELTYKKSSSEERSYYYARYYNPRTSIWLSVDPLVEQTMSAYGYCYQNPINLIDPTGMIAEGPNDWVELANGKMVWDDRVTDQASAETYYGKEATWRNNNGSYSRTLDSGMTITYHMDRGKGTGLKQYRYADGTFSHNVNQDNTPAKVPVDIFYYAALENDEGQMVFSSTGHQRVYKYPHKADGWIGATEDRLTIAKQDGSVSSLSDSWGKHNTVSQFFADYPNARNLDREKAGYAGLVTAGDAFGRVGAGIEGAGYVLSPATEGASLALAPIGKTVGNIGFGMSVYGNYKLDQKNKIFSAVLEKYITDRVIKLSR